MPKKVRYVSCPKCGTMVDIDAMRQRQAYECPECQEPIEALRALDLIDWSSDNPPDKEQ